MSTTEFTLQTWGYFGYRAIVLPKQHIVHCNIYQNNQDLSLPSGSDILPIYWSCWASAIYDLPINLRYIHKRVPALVCIQLEISLIYYWMFGQSTMTWQPFCVYFRRKSRKLSAHFSAINNFPVSSRISKEPKANVPSFVRCANRKGKYLNFQQICKNLKICLAWLGWAGGKIFSAPACFFYGWTSVRDKS